jgi:hypothetical protein
LISHVQLTNGFETKRAADWRARRHLGKPAPAEGWPVFDLMKNEDVLPLPPS